MRALIALVLVLLLANAGWWWLRGAGAAGHPRVPARPALDTPAASPPPAPVPAPQAPAREPVASEPVAPGPVLSAGPATGALPAGLLVPVRGVSPSQLQDTFGDARGEERQHEALDIMAAAGTPVLAVADGHVEKLFDSERGGLTVYQFEPSGRWCYYYAHLQSYAPGLAEGAQLRRGDVIGYVGSSGNADPGAPHLHFAVFALTPERQWWTGTPVNPYPLFSGAAP